MQGYELHGIAHVGPGRVTYVREVRAELLLHVAVAPGVPNEAGTIARACSSQISVAHAAPWPRVPGWLYSAAPSAEPVLIIYR